MRTIMPWLFLYAVLLLIFCTSHPTVRQKDQGSPATIKTYDPKLNPSIQSIGDIPIPDGFKRVDFPARSFQEWIRNIQLKKVNKVLLYNNRPKANQSLHYAVLNVSTGNKDLQQCADAIMRLRAEYLFSVGAFDEINFITANGTRMNFKEFAMGERYALAGQRLATFRISSNVPCYTHNCLMHFLHLVFAYCSTYSLAAQTSPIQSMDKMQPGDVFVKAGSPGHAMMVADVAVNPSNGKKIYMLLQSYMPAQDIHIVRNFNAASLSPWYEVNERNSIITPGYTFTPNQLKRWK